MNDLRQPWFGSMDDKHHPRWVRRTAVSKRGLKGALVVVVEVVVVATSTVLPKENIIALGGASLESKLAVDCWRFEIH